MSPDQRDHAAVRFFPPGIPLLAILLGIVLQRLWPLDPGFTIPDPVRYGVGGAILVAAIGLGVWAVMLFRRSGQNANPWKPTPAVVERGPFGVTRNPMYVQLVLLHVDLAFLLMNVWILLLTPLVVLALVKLVIEPEETYLERKFGEAYLAYKRRVRRWI